MDTETMIRNLKKVEDDHKGDKVFTGQLNIADMAHDVRLRLEELKPYEDTSLTQEQIMELVERDTAKAPIKDTDSGMRYTDDYICPNCRKHFTGTGIAAFCYHCGQRLKWED